MKLKRILIFCVWGLVMAASVGAQSLERITPGKEWPDRKGEHINAHGGGLLFHEGKYYWYGENRPARGFTTEVGVEVYSSSDLMNWEDEGVALAVSEEAGHDIERGCIMERPKVVRNPKTGKFVMLFHLELKEKGYAAARVGFAESDSPVGPFRFIRSLRPNAGKWPTDFSRRDIRKAKKLKEADYKEWWTPEWREAIREGLLLARDVPGGQMSRDMTVYVDDDGKAYHIYSAEENLTLNLAELTDDYLDYTGRYVRIAPGGQNEAPTIFKHDGVYWMITSGCTGWAPNEARMFKAASLWGPWEQLPSPFVGKDAKKSFHTQGTYIFKVEGTEDGFVFMADRWNPQSLKNSRHIWLPIDFEADGTPVIRWVDSWSPVERFGTGL
ncbi:MAG: family 43 glycosylhydrolase [Paraprevotella sp.]|uniref:glycoside hydrolase family 43 protein n=1 Tax=Paraprevotella sp. TaxID=2049036 RepID=UPI002579670E|nr:glycoside hydrolase family 43 protein [Paraprevotella sp.]MBS4807720.1 family 43 glycosylhydrolase [Paraprevotella sp.]